MVMKHIVVAFLAGVIFAVGLGVSGMTNPQRVIGFLDLTGRWDPSLAFVMLGAIGVHLAAALWALRASRPLWGGAFSFPRSTQIDRRLVTGAALFGVGWGITGYCPGPALVDLAAPSSNGVTFVIAMVAGAAAYHLRSAFPLRTSVARGIGLGDKAR
jgi:uncharacterized protein